MSGGVIVWLLHGRQDLHSGLANPQGLVATLPLRRGGVMRLCGMWRNAWVMSLRLNKPRGRAKGGEVQMWLKRQWLAYCGWAMSTWLRLLERVQGGTGAVQAWLEKPWWGHEGVGAVPVWLRKSRLVHAVVGGCAVVMEWLRWLGDTRRRSKPRLARESRRRRQLTGRG